jgi:Recombinase zinc beta ribbon domain/Recombinase
MELIAGDQKLPRRAVGQRRVRWARASYGAVHDFLTNPAYAGAFVFGRTRQQKRLVAHGQVQVRTVALPLEQWSVLIPEHHPGYVSWQQYLDTRERLRRNMRPRGEGGGAAREGAALLQGLLRCGRCGRSMQVAYSGGGGRFPRYACVRGRDLHGTGRACQSLGGTRLDRAVAAAFLEAVTPAGVRASAGAIAELEASTRSASRASASRSSGPSSRPTGPAASSTPASPSTGWSPAPWSGRSSRRSPPSSASGAGSPRSNRPARRR